MFSLRMGKRDVRVLEISSALYGSLMIVSKLIIAFDGSCFSSESGDNTLSNLFVVFFLSC